MGRSKVLFKFEEELTQLFDNQGKNWKNNFIIIGSTALKIQNLVSEPNHDIDIIISKNAMTNLKNNEKLTLGKSCIDDSEIYQDISKKIDTIEEGALNSIAPHSYWKNHALTMYGYKVLDPEANLTFYNGLYIRSKGKAKFLTRINQIMAQISAYTIWAKKNKKLDWLEYFNEISGEEKND